MENNELKDKDYSDEERYNRGRACGTALLKWLECEFFGVFVFLSLLAVRVVMHSAADVLFGLMGLVCYAVVLADFGLKEGSKARVKNTLRGDSVNASFGFLLGFISVLPALLSFAMPCLYAAGAGNLSALGFKVSNAGLWGILNIFLPALDFADMNGALLAVYPVIQLILAAIVAVTFNMGLKNDDIKTKIMYKNS